MEEKTYLVKQIFCNGTKLYLTRDLSNFISRILADNCSNRLSIISDTNGLVGEYESGKKLYLVSENRVLSEDKYVFARDLNHVFEQLAYIVEEKPEPHTYSITVTKQEQVEIV